MHNVHVLIKMEVVHILVQVMNLQPVFGLNLIVKFSLLAVKRDHIFSIDGSDYLTFADYNFFVDLLYSF
jgi:hypothetical protein